jgi:Leucine-rich repeat (LRR) protein
MRSTTITPVCIGRIYDQPIPTTSSNQSGPSPLKDLQAWIEKRKDKRCTEAAQIIRQCWEKQETKLTLTGYDLQGLPNEIWHCLPWLEELYVDRTNILHTTFGYEMPEGLRALIRLRILDFSSNRLSKVNDWIDELSQLENLKLDDNQLETLPENLSLLWKLTTLSINRNPLKEFPLTITLLPKLTTLYCTESGLVEMPRELGQMHRLAHLYLAGNKLQQMPDELGQLKNLITLDLEKNELSYVPRTIGQLENIKEVALLYNSLVMFPVVLTSSQSLVKFTSNTTGFHYVTESERFIEEFSTKGNLFGFVHKGSGIFERAEKGANSQH